MTPEEKELYAAIVTYYLMRGTIDKHEDDIADYITNWGKQHEGIIHGIQANIQQTVSLLR